MKKALILVLTVALLLTVAACGTSGPEPLLEQSPTLVNEASPPPGEVSPPPSSTPASPTPTLAEQKDPAEVFVNVVASDAGFDELYKKAEYVVLGTVMDDGVEYNAIRDFKDSSKPNTEYFMIDMSYSFKVTESLKGNLKKDNTIQYNLGLKENMDGKGYVFYPNFLAPEKGKTYLLFLIKDTTVKDPVYYVENEPHCFELKDNKLFVYTANEAAKKWMGSSLETGIGYAEAKKEMGLK